MERPLLLSGFMATGKSVVGRRVAEKQGADFLDLDELIERRTQKSVAQIFASEGEAGFRRLEAQILSEELGRGRANPWVMALGGGALLDRQLRILALSRAVVVTLSAGAEEILSRVETQDGASGARPLLAGPDRRERVEQLLTFRRSSYVEAHAVIETEDRPIDDIAADVIESWKESAVCVASGEQTYRVVIGSGRIQSHFLGLFGRPSGALLVTDSNVNKLHGAGVRSMLSADSKVWADVVLTPGEEHKNIAGLTQIYQAAWEASLDRKATFVGLGGGVVTDMTGFAAATWVRGVRWIGLPTTLLSMVDASVGGKTAVDFQTAKNSVGAFWQPAGVICDVSTLLTETDRMYVGAMSEVIKTALIGDADLLSFLEDNVSQFLKRDQAVLTELVDRCVRVKARVVALDEREAGVRATLNLGHTIGHALEASGGYTGLTHGEAVSLGLVAALRLGHKKGHTPAGLLDRVVQLMRRLGLPHELGREPLSACTNLLGHDKKRAGSAIRFVYARAPGDVFTESIGLSELIDVAPSLADA